MMPTADSRKKCRLGHFLTPGHFWFSPSPTSPELAQLARDLRVHAKTSYLIQDPLQQGDKGIVYLDTRRSWERAVAYKTSLSDGPKLKHYVRLVDRGVHLENAQVFAAPSHFFTKLPYMAFEFRLYGVQPPLRKTNEGIITRQWDADFSSDLEKFLIPLVVQVDIKFEQNNVYFGDVIFPDCDKWLSLTQLLLEGSLAEYYVTTLSSLGGNKCEKEKDQVPDAAVSEETYDSDDSTASFYSATDEIPSTPSPNKGQETSSGSSALSTGCSTELKGRGRVLRPGDVLISPAETQNKRLSFGRGQRRSVGIEITNRPTSNFLQAIPKQSNRQPSDFVKPSSDQNIPEIALRNVIQVNSSINSGDSVASFTNEVTGSTEIQYLNGFSPQYLNNIKNTGASKVASKQNKEKTDDKTKPIMLKVRNGEVVSVSSDAEDSSRAKTEKLRAPLERPITPAPVTPPTLLGGLEGISLQNELERLPRFYRILVRSSTETRPIFRLDDTPIGESLQMALCRKKITQLMPVQCHSIPAILESKSTVVVSGPKSGKTLGYVVPIIETLNRLFQQNEVPKGYGPLAVIMCSGTKAAVAISRLCCDFAYSSRQLCQVRVKTVYGCNEEKMLGKLVEGCEILVTTPFSLVRVLRGQVVTDLDRLRWIVVDEADQILRPPFDVEIELIRRKCEFVEKTNKLQWVVVGELVTPELWRLLRHIKDYTMLIGSHLEAAFYAQVKPVISISAKEKKIASLIDVVKPRVNKRRIVIICRINSEILEVQKALAVQGWDPLVTEDDYLQVEEVNLKWRRKEFPLLVCADTALEMLDMRDATDLIHFSLPARSKTMFGTRFSLLMDNYRDHSNPDKVPVELYSTLMLDEETQRQIPYLVEVLKRLGSDIPDCLHEFSEEVRREIELGKENLVLCNQLLSRGECLVGKLCPFRHLVLFEHDAPDPRMRGEVIFRPVTAIDGGSFSARLISANDCSGNRHEFTDFYGEISNAIHEHFKDREGRCLHGPVKLGDVCAVPNKSDQFFRARVEHISSYDDTNRPKTVQIRLLDDGTLHTRSVNDLWSLPQELVAVPAQAVIIHVTGLVPCDHDLYWSPESTNILKKLIERPLTDHEQWRGTVRMALRWGLVMDRICVMRNLVVEKFLVTEMELSEELKKAGATPNPEHLPRLIRLCSDAGIKPPRLPEKRVKRVKPQWAHFASEELPSVKFSCAESTSCIFLQNDKFSKQLKNIEELCKDEAENALMSGKEFRVRGGDICLVKNECNEWNRARVVEVENDEAQCFFVDHGDTETVKLNNITPISCKLITQLPFQIIECTLGGVVHPNPCPDEVLDEIYSFTRDGAEHCLASVQKLEGNPTKTGGRLYSVNLMNAKGVSFNKLMADKGALSRADDSTEFLQDIEVVESEKSFDNDLEEDMNSASTIFKASQSGSDPFGLDVPTSDFDFGNFLNNYMENASEEELEDFFADSADLKATLYKVVESQEHQFTEHCKTKLLEIKSAEQVGGKVGNELYENGKLEQIPNPQLSARQMDMEVKNEEGQNASLANAAEKELMNGPVRRRNESSDDDSNLIETIYLTPKVIWSQDAFNVKIKVEIIDVSKKRLTGTNRSFNLTCVDGKGKKYRVNCELFGAIHWDRVSASATARELRLVLPKAVPRHKWLRLPRSLERDPMIAYDPDANFSDDESTGASNHYNPWSTFEDFEVRPAYDSDDSLFQDELIDDNDDEIEIS